MLEFLARPNLEWKEPPGFRRECLGLKARIRWTQHLLFLAIIAACALYTQSDFFGQSGEMTWMGYVWTLCAALIVSYGHWLLQFQPLPVRVTKEELLCMRPHQGSFLPSLGILRIKLESLSRVQSGKVLCDDKEFEYFILVGSDGAEILRVGLDCSDTQAKLFELFKNRGIACASV